MTLEVAAIKQTSALPVSLCFLLFVMCAQSCKAPRQVSSSQEIPVQAAAPQLSGSETVNDDLSRWPLIDRDWATGVYSPQHGLKISESGLGESEISTILQEVSEPDVFRGMAREQGDEELVIFHVDMGEGQQNGLAVMGTHELCSATNYCDFWLFRKEAGTWISVPGRGYTVNEFKFLPPNHNGILELWEMGHGGVVNVLWFDRTSYELHGDYCAVDGHLEPDDGGCPPRQVNKAAGAR